MKGRLKGSFTIEAAVIVPILLTVFAVIITMLFYYHDKNVIAAITHETLVKACSQEEVTEEEVAQYMRARIRGKLIVFGEVNPVVEVGDDEIEILGKASQNNMSIHVKMCMKRTNPEQYIWKLRRINGIGKGEKD